MQLLGTRVTTVVTTTAVGLLSFGVAAVAITYSPSSHNVSGATPLPSPSTAASLAPVEELPIGDVVQVRSGAEIVLPVDGYRLPAGDQNMVYEAEHKAMESCMLRFGAAFDVPPQTVPAERTDYDRLFGVLDLSLAKKSGYHIPGDEISNTGQTAARSTKSLGMLDEHALSIATGEATARNRAVESLPSGGCVSESRETVGVVNPELVEAAIGYGLEQSDRDVRVLAAFRAWSTCMAERGFKYETPAAAINDPRWATQRASQDEIATAVADVTCKNETNLTGVRVAVASAWQEKYIRSHRESFDKLGSALDEQVAHSKELLLAG